MKKIDGKDVSGGKGIRNIKYPNKTRFISISNVLKMGRKNRNYVVVDESECVGCYACESGCPVFGAITFKNEIAHINLCDRGKCGDICVSECPTGALS